MSYLAKDAIGYEWTNWESFDIEAVSESVIKDIPVEDDEYTFSMTAKGVLIINDSEYDRM